MPISRAARASAGGPAAGPILSAMKPPADAFTLDIAVQPADIDQLNHVNSTVYLRWMQDAAVAHWFALAPRQMQAAVFWVVRRHEIDYLHSARLGDVVVTHTWVGVEIDGYFERFTQMARERDNRTLARARSLWAPMDMGTGTRIRSVPDDVRALFAAAT